jgi:hypothetical protein
LEIIKTSFVPLRGSKNSVQTKIVNYPVNAADFRIFSSNKQYKIKPYDQAKIANAPHFILALCRHSLEPGKTGGESDQKRNRAGDPI